MSKEVTRRELIHSIIAAALSVKDRRKPREIDIAKLQSVLRQQGAFLG